ncbi:MAG TPA: SDR family oxidoreductase [Thermoanaerobaculia bacterium]
MSGRPRALVTGASSGIGAAFAERLAKDGSDLVVVARRKDRLDEHAARLHAEHGVSVDVLPADLTRAEELLTVEKRAAEDSALELLVNNAGFGAYAPFAGLDPDVAEDLVRLHVVALTRLTRAALPGMIERGRGAIVNVSSRLAYSGSLQGAFLPKRAVYAGAKAYINVFTEVLANELAGTGVKAQALCPGIVRTEFHVVQGMDPSRFPPDMVMKPADVVEASLEGLRRGEVICIPALDDPGLLDAVHEAERRLFEGTTSGTAAGRRDSGQ